MDDVKVLLVSQNKVLRESLVQRLNTRGYTCCALSHHANIPKTLAEHVIDLVVTDVDFPGLDRIGLCAEIKSKYSIPIILLSTENNPIERILCLEAGADDCLSKPIEPLELVARIRSMLRRTESRAIETQDNIRLLKFDGWTLDVTQRLLFNSKDVMVSLTGTEFQLLRTMLEHPNQVMKSNRLLNRIKDPWDSTIYVQISRIRKKLGDFQTASRIIRTVRNRGYMIDVDVNRVMANNRA